MGSAHKNFPCKLRPLFRDKHHEVSRIAIPHRRQIAIQCAPHTFSEVLYCARILLVPYGYTKSFHNLLNPIIRIASGVNGGKVGEVFRVPTDIPVLISRRESEHQAEHVEECDIRAWRAEGVP